VEEPAKAIVARRLASPRIHRRPDRDLRCPQSRAEKSGGEGFRRRDRSACEKVWMINANAAFDSRTFEVNTRKCGGFGSGRGFRGGKSTADGFEFQVSKRADFAAGCGIPHLPENGRCGAPSSTKTRAEIKRGAVWLPLMVARSFTVRRCSWRGDRDSFDRS
jgi:hypothetical protein